MTELEYSYLLVDKNGVTSMFFPPFRNLFYLAPALRAGGVSQEWIDKNLNARIFLLLMQLTLNLYLVLKIFKRC